MAEGGISPELRPAPVSPGTKEVRPNLQETTLKYFNSAFTELEAAETSGSLLPQDKLNLEILRKIKAETLDKSSDSFENKFQDVDNPGREFNQIEGLPVEGLIDFLTREACKFPPGDTQRLKLLRMRSGLARNSRAYYEIEGRGGPDQWLNRVRQEAYYISQDPDQTTGDQKADFLKAADRINKRRELIIQAKKTRVRTSREPKATPATALTPESSPIDTAIAPAPDTEAPTPLTPDKIAKELAYELTVVNATDKERKAAAITAEQTLHTEMRRGHFWDPRAIFRRMSLRVGEEFHRQRFIQRAAEMMRNSNNSLARMDIVRNAVVDANHQIDQEKAEGRAKIEAIHTGVEQGAIVREATGELRTAFMNDILNRVIDGSLAEQDLQQALRTFIGQHANDSTIQEVFGHDATRYGVMAEYFATDIIDLAARIKTDKAAITAAGKTIDEVVKINFANASWSQETQIRFNTADRVTAWAQKTGRGWLINPATVGAAASIIGFASGRTAGALVAGPLAGAVFAGIRRNRDLKIDRAITQIEMVAGGTIGENSPRREKVAGYINEMVAINTLREGGIDRGALAGDSRGLSELTSLDLSQQVNREALLRRVAEITTRLDFGREHHTDLVTFAGQGQIEQGRLQLAVDIGKARAALKTAGMEETEMQGLEATFSGQWETRFIQNLDQQERAFRIYRYRSMVGAGIFGGVAGLTGGLALQEGMAEIARLNGANVNPTALETFFGAKPHAPTITEVTPTGEPPHFNPLEDRILPNGTKIDFLDNGHRVSILNADGQPIVSNLEVKDGVIVGAGSLSDQAREELHASGLEFKQLPDIHTTTVEALGQNGEWQRLHADIARREWYGYDTGRNVQNELRFHTLKHGDTLTLSMTRMGLSESSKLNPTELDVQNIIKNHESGFAFHLPGHGTIWVQDGADGTWDGRLNLDPNDTTNMVTMPNGEKITLGNLSKLLVDQEALSKYPDGNIATQAHHRTEVFRMGADDKRGRIEAGRLIDRNGRNVLQIFATIRGSGTPENITQEITKPGGFEIKLPEPTPPPIINVENPIDIPFIATPFAPRFPLKEMMRNITPYGYGGEYSSGGYGLLDRAEYKNRRSPTLTSNPEAILDEKMEIERYLDSLSPEYKATLESFDSALPAMNENCRVAITIPAYGEGSNIHKALEQLLGQHAQDGTPLDTSTYEVIILDNHPATVSKDATEAEVQRFRSLHPEINVRYAERIWSADEASVGNARKHAADLALLRSSKRSTPHGDLILISFDADIDGISNKYVSDVLTQFDSNPKLDTAAGKWTLPEETLSKPNLRAAQRLWYILDRVIQRDAEGTPTEREIRNPGLVGRNAAIKASMYAGIGGYNPSAKIAEDLELGWMTDAARGYDSARKERTNYINTAAVISNPRRFLAAQVQGVPLIQMYGGFHEDTSVRTQNNEQLLSQIPDVFDVKKFEHEADALWQAWRTGQYKWLGERFRPLFDRTMGLMGAEYKIENEHVVITNAQKLIEGLSETDSTVKPAPSPEATPTAPAPTSTPSPTPSPTPMPSSTPTPVPTSTPTPTPTPSRASPTSTPLASPVATTAPAPSPEATPTAGKDLLTEARDALATATGTTANFEVTPTQATDFLKTIPLPNGAKIINVASSISAGQLLTNGRISTPGGEIKFSLTLANDPSGKLVIVDKKIDMPFLVRAARGKDIESQIGNLNELILGQLTANIDPVWQATNLQIAGDKLAVNFVKS